LANLDHVRASSGTSGKAPLFSPRTHVRGMEYRLRFHDFKKPFLAFTVPLMPHWHEMFQKEHGGSSHVICLDPRHPKASARLAAAAGADAFSAFVYHVRDLGEEMKALGTNGEIRFIEVTGEVCGRAQIQYMRDTFPNATIVQSYNSSEVEDAHIGTPCRPLTPEEPLAHYHPKKTHYLELLNPESGAIIEPREGAEGDLLVTTYPGEPASFPLIRYRIGDTVRIVESPCAEHGTWSFTVLGRTDMDFVKIPGGIIRADEIARTLSLFSDVVTDRFELHCSEQTAEHGPKLSLTLHVDARTNAIDLVALSQNIASHLHVSPDFTYADGVRLNRYEALACTLLTTSTGAKARRIVWDSR
ncbi:MAG: phenylacetate--CoA ligase family protein, partial [Minisyncoccota bacterium]